jgi:hypothetical protein
VTIQVHLLALPVPLAARSSEHFAGLMREFTLIAAGSGEDAAEPHVPTRLTQLVSELTAAYGGINSEADERLLDAIDRHEEVIDDHVLTVPKAAGPAAKALNDIIEEADEYCRQGEHLLTLAFPPDLAAYRSWYLGQVLDQLDGKPPVAWPDSEQAAALDPGQRTG